MSRFLTDVKLICIWTEKFAYRGVAQFGRALRSGRRGRVFESRRLDLPEA